MDFLDHLFTELPNQPSPPKEGGEETFPEGLKDWFRKLFLLKGVPLSYLVPHPHLLPLESIRFFDVDTNWLKALAAGAFSLGQYPYETEAEAQYRDFSKMQVQAITGVLLRSELVAHYPGMYLKGYSRKVTGALPTESLAQLRNEKLGPDIRIVLFNGDVKTVALFSPPESLELRVPIPETGEKDWINGEGVLQTSKLHKKPDQNPTLTLTQKLLSAGSYILYKRKKREDA